MNVFSMIIRITIVFLNSINQLIFAKEKCCVFFAVETEPLNTVRLLIKLNATVTSRLPAGTA
jgi:hypothetical protein